MSEENSAKKEDAQLDRKVIFADDFRSFYANWVEAGYGPFDISLLIADSRLDDDGTFTVKRTARIVMNPAEAQIVVRILLDVIGKYERTWGKIVEPTFQEQKPEEQKTEGD